LAKVAAFTTKLHTKNESYNIAQTVIRSTEPPLLPNPCYAFVVLFGRGLFVNFYGVLVRLVGGSFGFFSVGLWVVKNTNVPPKAVAHCQVKFLLEMGR
jgi:hypothetical protein